MGRVVGVAVAAASALLAAACSASPQSPAGAATAAVLHAYGKKAYRLGAETRDYSAQVIVEQVPGGIAVLAAGGYFHIGSRVCRSRLRFVFFVNGQQLFQWDGPVRHQCLTGYASGYRPVCVPGARHQGGPSPAAGARLRGIRAAGCEHPVLPVDAAVDAMLTGENTQSARWRAVRSVGIVLLPRRTASGEQ